MSNLTRQQLLAHGHNMDAAYREIDRRDAQGEDMSRAYVDQSTYAILFAPASASDGTACPKCSGLLTKARGLVSAGYQFACLACDEDFYTIEIKGGI